MAPRAHPDGWSPEEVCRYNCLAPAINNRSYPAAALRQLMAERRQDAQRARESHRVIDHENVNLGKTERHMGVRPGPAAVVSRNSRPSPRWWRGPRTCWSLWSSTPKPAGTKSYIIAPDAGSEGGRQWVEALKKDLRPGCSYEVEAMNASGKKQVINCRASTNFPNCWSHLCRPRRPQASSTTEELVGHKRVSSPVPSRATLVILSNRGRNTT